MSHAALATLPPEADTIKSLVRIAGIISLVIGILNLIWGIMLLIVLVGIIGVVFAIIDIWLYSRCNHIVRLIESGDLRKAKEETLVPMILGFIFSWIIVGILLLIAYIKYDEAIRALELKSRMPPPPPKI